MSRISLFFLTFSMAFVWSAEGQKDSTDNPSRVSSLDSLVSSSDSSDGNCLPQITISNKSSSRIICLNHLEPSGDSCAEVEFDFKDINGTKIGFSCSNEHVWNYSGVTCENQTDRRHMLKVDITTEQDNKLVKASISLTNLSDSSKNDKLELNRVYDLPSKPDTVEPLDYSIKRIAFICFEKSIAKGPEYRKYTYPGNYMRRGPAYNYPELSMFHYGGSVHMPTSGSVADMGDLILYWHILHPNQLKFKDKDVLLEEHYLSNQRRAKAYEDSVAAARKLKQADHPKKLTFKPL